jgi:hypothetical protein
MAARSKLDEDSDSSEDPEAKKLLINFARIRDAKTRALILSLVVAYAENESVG